VLRSLPRTRTGLFLPQTMVRRDCGTSTLCGLRWGRAHRGVRRDSRRLDKGPFFLLEHDRAVTGAHLSPDARVLLTTSNDSTIRAVSLDHSVAARGSAEHVEGTATSVRHNNNTGRWITPFQAVWHPGCSSIACIGSMEHPRRVDALIVSGATELQKPSVSTIPLSDPDHLTSIPAVNAFGGSADDPGGLALASGNASGRVFLWWS
jgi:WD repeat-containing protein 76